MTANLSPFSFTPLDLVRDLPVHSNLSSATTLSIRLRKGYYFRFFRSFPLWFSCAEFCALFSFGFFLQNRQCGPS